MNVLITGIAGFIGSNLAKLLLDQGCVIYGIDNFSYGFERNISNLINNKKFHFIKGDLADPSLLKNTHVDVIVHLASQKIPRYTSALRTLDENYLMLRNIVDKCLKDKSRIVFASTSDVYGKNEKLPFHEESDLVLGPTDVKRWAYACSKIHGEQYIIANYDEFGLDYTITRFFGSYGPNQNLTWWGGPQSVFISKALNNEPIEIHGNGLQSRTFTFIDDTVDGLSKVILNEMAVNEVFNIGSNIESDISILELGKLIWQLIQGEDSVPLLKFIPYSDFGKYEDVQKRIPDISKITRLLGFQPLHSLKEGLLKTITWQREIIYS